MQTKMQNTGKMLLKRTAKFAVVRQSCPILRTGL